MGYTVSSKPAWDALEKRDREKERKKGREGGRESRVPVAVRNSLNHKCTLSRSPDQPWVHYTPLKDGTPSTTIQMRRQKRKKLRLA